VDTAHLMELRRTEAGYWWHVNKRRVARLLLDRYASRDDPLLEVGCGAGLLASELCRDGWRVVAADVLPAAVAFARTRGVPEGAVMDAGARWPFPDGSFGTVLMMDVLEHIEDDAGCLAEARRVLKDGGRVVLSVPACPFLYSPWDRMLGHRRRYSRRRLRAAAADAGLEAVRTTAWNLIGLGPAMFARGWTRLFGSSRAHAEFPKVPRFAN